ncbi:hypothetical protein HAX54_052312 [Datura stramonium]|uniref:Ubiquitin-like protease family profile domain-containing protein n=1 Tax=Datura stramonium TaxID=4076 RepID=A0ABS8SZN9_DATST|nr:hypothetical protein [Datura stramonium]
MVSPNPFNSTYDCGVFMIKNADFYSRDIGLCFNQEHMRYFRMRTAKELLRLIPIGAFKYLSLFKMNFRVVNKKKIAGIAGITLFFR